jgi:Dolichyl-phosphate-mannose-protein mannosyltransferase
MKRLLPPLMRALRTPVGWIAIGTMLRIVHLLTLGNRYYFGDTAEYQAAALRILHGIGLDQASPRAPLYPLLMATGFSIGGEGNMVATRWLQLLVAITLMFVTSRLAGRIAGPTAATLTAAGMAVAPTLVFVSGLLYPTTLYMLMLVGFAYLVLRLGEDPTLRDGAMLGIVFALGFLADQVFLAPSLAIALWLLSRLRTHGTTLARALTVGALCATALLTPYSLATRAPSGGSSSDHIFMRKAQTVLHSARTDPVLSRERWMRFPQDASFEALSPGRFLLREGSLFARYPVAYTHDYVFEFLHFFRPVPDRVQTENRFTQPIVLYVGGLYFIALLILSFLGLGFGAGLTRHRILLTLGVLGTAAFYAFFFTQARYRIPVEPFLIILAAIGVARAFPGFARYITGLSAESERPSA